MRPESLEFPLAVMPGQRVIGERVFVGRAEPGVDLQYLLIFEGELHDLLHEVADLVAVDLLPMDLGLHQGYYLVPALHLLLL